MSPTILLLPGDGIGPEIVAQAARVLEALNQRFGLNARLESALVGGAAFDETGEPLPEDTLEKARNADAVLLGAVGGPRWAQAPRDKRPEKGLLRLRSELGLFANLRPAFLYPELVGASSLRRDMVEGLDIMIVRELTGGIYFGEPRELSRRNDGERVALNTMIYDEVEIRRIARAGFEVAMQRGRRLCSVDKANVLEVSELWREVVDEVGQEFPQVSLSHMYVDNAAMQLVRAPNQFDVIVTGNLFGDILSDAAAMLTGSIGMLPSASLNQSGRGMYEPVHGSAPDIAGQDKANPLATILSVGMMLRYSLARPDLADKVEASVAKVLADGMRTADIVEPGGQAAGTSEIGDAAVDALT